MSATERVGFVQRCDEAVVFCSVVYLTAYFLLVWVDEKYKPKNVVWRRAFRVVKDTDMLWLAGVGLYIIWRFFLAWKGYYF